MVKLVASLKAIPRWDNRLVPTNYLLLAATTGMLWFDALLRLFGAARLDASTAAAAVIVLAWTAKSRYWSAIDRAASAAAACLAAVVSLIGVVIECWLFFAEAEHVVTLYYGKSAV